MKLGNVVSDIQLESKLGKEFVDIADELAQELKDQLENQNQVNEVVVSILAYVMLSNGIMGLLGKLTKRISKKYNFGKGQAAAEKIESFVKANDKRFMFPIRKAVGLFTKDEKTKNTVTDGLFALLLLGLGAKAGTEAFSAIRKSNFIAGGVSGVKAALKGKDITTLVQDIVSNV